jgi:hypothetical protein
MSKQILGVVACAAVLLAACGGSDGAPTPAVTEAVPADASTSSAAATRYVAALTAVASVQTDSLEPVSPVPDTLATDDTAEPKVVE